MTVPFPALIATCWLTFFSICSAQESSLLVSSTSDDGAGSLRQAIAEIANGGIITFSSRLNGSTITLTNDQISINKSLVIDASTLSNGLTIDAGGSDEVRRRVFEIRPGHNVIVDNLTIINGFTADGRDGGTSIFDGEGGNAYGGGAIFNSGGLTLFNCTFRNNQTGRGGNGTTGKGGFGGSGGAIFNQGSLTLGNCTFDQNRAGVGGTGGNGEGGFGSGDRAGPGGNGGAIANTLNATLNIARSTFSNNTAGDGSRGGDGVNTSGSGGTGGIGGSGGAIHNEGDLTLTNCTLAGNTTGQGGEGGNAELRKGADGGPAGNGGAIHNGPFASLSLTHCTLAGNQTNSGGQGGFEGERDFRSGRTGSDGDGGGIYSEGTVEVTNSIISSNVSPATNDLFGEVTENGVNILNSDFPINLRPLGDYGGPTLTMLPFRSSPAVDAAGESDPMSNDQRGFNRLFDGNNDGISSLDIGAVELQSEQAEFDIQSSLDSDGDGLSNIEELVRGSEPMVPDNNGLENLSLTSFDQTTGIPTLGFAYRDSEVRLRIIRSTDLQAFDTVVADSNSTEGFKVPDDESLLEIQDPAPPVGRAFYRLEIVRPE